MKHYTQNDEQRFILAACPNVGKFLDIGAWDPFDLSNTRALYESGWSGVMVEPSPVPFAGLIREYGARDRVRLVRAAVVLDGANEVKMHPTRTAFSTTEQQNYQKWKQYVRDILGDGSFDRQITVPATSLEALYKEHGDFDFVSIDTEGTSTDLLVHLLGIGKTPNCICVEHDERIAEVLEAAAENYRLTYRSAENLVLVRNGQCG